MRIRKFTDAGFGELKSEILNGYHTYTIEPSEAGFTLTHWDNRVIVSEELAEGADIEELKRIAERHAAKVNL